ncbi:hypothetical protein XA68_14416 [Ophiocordyceps unilateralis]|uniref:BTB domain-containing protein n=1 Tax=Ophiocordyceps unilateralis TaxID=268505 RepID=A0A2A9PAM1_OPHUN|nr:hypothetical protein XA68_14416 [Ophiocordyceps unilateralis]
MMAQSAALTSGSQQSRDDDSFAPPQLRKNSAPGLTLPSFTTPTTTTKTTTKATASKHGRQLSLQNSLSKPLPQAPLSSSEGVMMGEQNMSSSIGSLASSARRDSIADESARRTPGATTPSRPHARSSGSAHLSGLMCNVHRTTGREPPPLVGATTTVLGDKLYVFGGRILSRSKPAPLVADLYELDLVRRHWSRLETAGDLPPPRYFHSMCPLGDTKLVCYGGMTPAPAPSGEQQQQQQQESSEQQKQPDVSVMSDIHIYDVLTKHWTYVPAQDAPQGRYAHCACVLPSTANFSSTRAPLSALEHNPPSSPANPGEGRIGVNIDGSGGAEMVVVGGQDGNNHYIEQISVFNLRSLKWTSTQPLGKSCGAYRSVASPLPAALAGRMARASSQSQDGSGSSMLIYSNYNFLDVKLELQIRSSDGTLTERPMSGTYSPPGLRFPNGGIIDTHFVVSGTYLTSSKQEYALWALDLRSLTWSRIDAGGSVFSQGSWNRGVLWNRRNTFVILGNRKRSLVDDYNHRRINFSNVCMVELEAFGFYDNPRRTSPMSGFISASSPYSGPGLSVTRKAGYTAGGRTHARACEELGEKALGLRELADMDLLCIGGERIPVNSRMVARRWGPYFVQLLREGSATPVRASSQTMIVPADDDDDDGPTTAPLSADIGEDINPAAVNTAPTPRSLPPGSRPRCLYLPHTHLTVQALVHFLYTSTLPPPSSPLCTPQILCSLLQVARPYRVDGLLEAIVERLHGLLENRNAAAIFNATAMAAGGGRGIDGSLNPNFSVGISDPMLAPTATSDFSLVGGSMTNGSSEDQQSQKRPTTSASSTLHVNTSSLPQRHSRTPSGELSATTSVSGGSEWGSELGPGESQRPVWNGELSSVIGLQKRGLRGLMDGRRMRERSGPVGGSSPSYLGGNGRVGLGIAGS